MRTTRTAIAGTLAGLVVLVGPAAVASAAETHHESKAQKKADRIHDRRVARRADHAAHKPAQDTTTTSAATPAAPRTPGKATKTRGVVSCGVTADRAGSSFTVHNGCDTTEAVTVSVQSQPGPWHVGLCRAGGCHLLTRYDVQVPPGTHTITVATGGGCWVQVDVKWRGRLIRSNHYVNACKPTTPVAHPMPVPPVQTHPRPVGHHHPATRIDGPQTLAYTGSEDALLAGAGLLFILAGAGVTVAARKRQTA